MIRALALLIGMATVYAGPYVGQPLYCDRSGAGTAPLTYRRDTRPWVALDVRLFQSGAVRCGDWIRLRFPASAGRQPGVLVAQALDAGPFAGYYVVDHPDLPIIVDVPAHLWPLPGLSSVVHLTNLSAIHRAWEARARHGHATRNTQHATRTIYHSTRRSR